MEAKVIKSNNRMALLLIAGIPVTVIFVATWLWYFVVYGELDLVTILGTSNSGTLIEPPRQLDDFDISQDEGASFKYSELDPKWTFLIPGAASCDMTCEKTLYTTRQIHIGMGKALNRIRRVYLTDTAAAETAFSLDQLSDGRPAPAQFAEFISSEHRGMMALTMSGQQHAALLPEFTLDPSTWYLVDPAGWIMMSYDFEVDYKGVMSDLKFLLKNSSE